MGLNEVDIRRVLWTAVQAFLGTFLTLAVGFLNAPNWSGWKAAAVSAIVASVAAAFSAVKNLLLSDDSTLK
jgi:hypothetical protein